MARVSRKAMVIKAEETAVLPERIFHTAIYLRLSVENNHHSREQESINMQRYMLEKYVEAQPDMQLQGIFCDNGETGTNFERPGFEQMMDEVRKRKIDCIVVKDLSRFGRNYIETGYYLEKIFPHLGIRFVAVNDQYDTSNDENRNELIVSLKNLVNDLYAKDISRKISTAFETKHSNGEFTGSIPPYGYKKSPENKNKLIPDPEAAKVVRDIFQWRLEGRGFSQIVRTLNGQGIPCPSLYHYQHGCKKKPGQRAFWQSRTVKRITENEVYLGHLVYGRTKQSLCDGIPIKSVPHEEWRVVKHTHQAIIGQETFDQVQEINRKNYEQHYALRGKHGTTENILKGFLICTDCGARMVRIHTVTPAGVSRYIFKCWVYMQNLSGQGCSKKLVGEPEMKECLLQSLRVQIELAGKLEQMLKDLQQQPDVQKRRRELEENIRKTNQKIRRNTALKGSLFESYSEHLLTEEEYRPMKVQYDQEAEQLREELSYLEEEKSRFFHAISPQNEWISAVKKYQGEKAITRGMLQELLSCVRVSGYNEVEIIWKFQDEFSRIAEAVREVEK